MKMVCANCDLGLKRSDCNERDYIECECRRWLTEHLKQTTVHQFIYHTLDEALDGAYQNVEEKRDIKIRMIADLSRSVIR